MSHQQGGDPLAHSLSWRRLFLRRSKLKASSRTSALMSGFAMVAMVELNVEKDVPEGLLVTFSVLTTLLISIHVFALMISTCILPNLESIAQVLPHHSAITDSPHEKMHTYIEMAWIFSTGLGTLLLLAEIAVIAWVKFYLYSKAAAVASTIVIIPVCVVFLVFAMHFYNSLVKHKYECSTRGIQELQLIAKHLQSPNPVVTTTQHV